MNYLSSNLVSALSSLNMHDFPHFCEYELNKLLNTIKFCSARTTYFRGCLKNNRVPFSVQTTKAPVFIVM